MEQLEVGDIVMVLHSFMGCEPATTAFVYETYQDFDNPEEKGVSLILENGRDLGGFSRKEQKEYLLFVRNSGFSYEFKNIIKLSEDFRRGFFWQAFKFE